MQLNQFAKMEIILGINHSIKKKMLVQLNLNIFFEAFELDLNFLCAKTKKLV